MQKDKQSVSRKKFLSWGVGIGSLLAIPAFLRFQKKKKEVKTARMLTQDGRLVEVDLSRISSKGTKIKPDEIHTWVNKKKI